MSIPTFAERQKQWSSPPVDDVGYLPSKDLLTWTDEALVDLVTTMEQTRYGGWRNWRGRWRDVLGLDETHDKDVLDYGCGVGIESLQYARNGNRVTVADISPDNVALAERVLDLFGYPARLGKRISEKPPFLRNTETYDVIHCCGVLHHIPDAKSVVKQMHGWLRHEGEVRLMVYSDKAWEIATGTEAPDGDAFDYVEFEKFWRHWDPIGGYAEFYNATRLQARFGEWFTVRRCKPLTEGGEYLGAILVKK